MGFSLRQQTLNWSMVHVTIKTAVMNSIVNPLTILKFIKLEEANGDKRERKRTMVQLLVNKRGGKFFNKILKKERCFS